MKILDIWRLYLWLKVCTQFNDIRLIDLIACDKQGSCDFELRSTGEVVRGLDSCDGRQDKNDKNYFCSFRKG